MTWIQTNISEHDYGHILSSQVFILIKNLSPKGRETYTGWWGLNWKSSSWNKYKCSVCTISMIESIKTKSMEKVSTGVLEKIKNNI